MTDRTARREEQGADMIAAGIGIAMIVFLGAAVGFGMRNDRIPRCLRAHPGLPKVLTLGYIVFAGCFVFPISSEPFPLDFEKAYILIANYGAIAWARAEVFGPGRKWRIYLLTVLFTAVGMGCRYLLEYGEVSNTYNFTLFNMVSYLLLIPAGTAVTSYLIAGRREQ